jgi:hypothetical protein
MTAFAPAIVPRRAAAGDPVLPCNSGKRITVTVHL